MKEGNFKELSELISVEVYNFSKFYTEEYGYPLLEIVVFITTPSGGWWGARCVKFATWSRGHEEITTIYNHNNGAHYPSEVTFDRNTKILSIKPYSNNLIYRIFIVKLPIR